MKKILFISIPLIVVILIMISGYLYIPQKERCNVSEKIAKDPKTGYFLKFVDCRKGLDKYFEFNWNSDKMEYIESSSGYIIMDDDDNIIKTIKEKKNNNVRDYYVDFYSPDKSTNPRPKYSFSNYEDKYFVLTNNQLAIFENTDIKYLGKIPNNFFAYENGDMYYIDHHSNYINGDQDKETNRLNIMKYNIFSDKSTRIISLDNLKRDELYSRPYDINVTKLDKNLIMTFSIVTDYIPGGNQNKEFYSLNLYTGELNKLNKYPYKQAKYYNVPVEIKYSQVFNSAEKYGLFYNKNKFVDFYYFVQSFFR